MKTLNKAQRHLLYKKVLTNVVKEGWQGAGFCYAFSRFTEIDLYQLIWEPTEFKKLLPELASKAPKQQGNNDYWFSLFTNRDIKRENILKRCIKETAPKPRSK
jgi:hypothetical protein